MQGISGIKRKISLISQPKGFCTTAGSRPTLVCGHRSSLRLAHTSPTTPLPQPLQRHLRAHGFSQPASILHKQQRSQHITCNSNNSNNGPLNHSSFSQAPHGLGSSTPLPNRQPSAASTPRNVACNAASASTPAPHMFSWYTTAKASIQVQLQKLDGLWARFIPMSALFFLLAFLNTIFDSLKDSLVVTAVGGGSGVLPYLTVYAVLPSSVLFLVAYAWGTQRFSRERLFNIIIISFLAFYGGFAFFYPMHETLHLGAWADDLTAALPSGLSGLVGMVRNWMFTLFYCASELWGDVVLSLLFWGLANETTSIEDAPLLYPLFGVGANVAQTVAGRVLRIISDAGSSSANYTIQLQSALGICVALGFIILALHAYISKTFPKNPKGSTAVKMVAVKAEAAKKLAAEELAAATAAAGGGSDHHSKLKVDLEASVTGLNYCDLKTPHASSSSTNGNGTTSSTTSGIDNRGTSTSTTTEEATKPHREKEKPKPMSLKEAWNFLKASPQIRCLSMMALAQGITTRLLQVTWMHYLHELHTTPAAYAAFLGDTAMWTGIVTGTLMFTSPMLFDRIGWKGVASVTPNVMIWGGVPFFIGCIIYNFMAGKLLLAGAVTLQALVIMGAIMQVFSRGAKFSLFKPAEEMVYIGLDDESRTKGKAAIDVVGAQSGKSVGSMLQQALLIITGGTIGGILPVLAVFYAYMLREWKRSVIDLADYYDPAHVHRMSVLGSLDESDFDTDIDGQFEVKVPSPAAA